MIFLDQSFDQTKNHDDEWSKTLCFKYCILIVIYPNKKEKQASVMFAKSSNIFKCIYLRQLSDKNDLFLIVTVRQKTTYCVW